MDPAVKRNDLEMVSYALWRWSHVPERLLRAPVALAQHLLQHNQMCMLRLLVPRVMRISNFVGIRLAAGAGHDRVIKCVVTILRTVA